LSVEDNQIVKEGDTLVVLDDRDLALRVIQAEAALENAKASLATSQASYTTSQENVLTSRSNTEAADASIEIAQVRAKRAEQDFKRYQELIKTNSVTQQQYEQAEAEKDAALKQLDVARRQREALSRETSARKAQSNVSDRNIALAQTVVKEREADLQFARLQLSYSYILAPATGVISRKSVQPGQYVQAGQSLFALVTEKQKWVVANFKETQLDKMKAGQIVEIKVDAFPGDVFSGKIESLSPATGAKFSLLPADNAGMNVIVDVHLD
jgi:membrane fusion protein (multidrug efflux system)